MQQLAFDTGAVSPRPVGEHGQQRLGETKRGKGGQLRIIDGIADMFLKPGSGWGWRFPRIILHRRRCRRIFP